MKFLYNSVLPEARENQHNSVMNLMKEYGETLDNKDKGKNLITKLLIEKRIRIIPINKEMYPFSKVDIETEK